MKTGHDHDAPTIGGIPDGSASGSLSDVVRRWRRQRASGKAPRIALFTGPCVGYPYYAYYSHALLSLGLCYVPVDAAAIAAGGLDRADVLVIPGGFAIWGLDRAEGAPGADAAVQRFLSAGGGFIGSCGGAYYASAGRPGWIAMTDAKPKYSHEYLQTGAGIVNVTIGDARFAEGVGRQIEVPYYHGPSWPDGGSNARVIATFDSLALPSRLFIDNPLERIKFEADLAGRAAALLTDGDGERGRGVLFSMHPEMGDLVRRHMALDGYVRKYLPIRGEKVLDDTLRHYAPDDAPAFRLIDRSMQLVAPEGRNDLPIPASPRSTEQLDAALAVFSMEVAQAIAMLEQRLADCGADERDWSQLVAKDLARIRAEAEGGIERLRSRCCGKSALPDALLPALLAPLLADAGAMLAGLAARPVIEVLALIELPVRVLVAADRVLAGDDALPSITAGK